MGAVQQAFQHRSARVIALCRAVLAFFFALAVASDFGREDNSTTFLLLLGYMIFAIAKLAVTWNDWWLEARLSPYAHLIDLIVFTILVFLTDGYTSPFFTFFVFLVLAAAIRWGWREALLTTLAVVVLYIGASLSAGTSHGIEAFEVQRFVVRGANLIVLSFMIIWFGLNQGRFRPGAPDQKFTVAANAEPPVAEVMGHALARLGGEKVVFAWSDTEEPWLNIWTLEHGSLVKERHGPDAFGAIVDISRVTAPFLFDIRQRRLLYRSGNRRLTSGDIGVLNRSFADRLHLREGVALRIEGGDIDAWLFVAGVSGLCSDDLTIAVALGKQFAGDFERYALLKAHQEAAASRSRLLLARDLHDSVAQFLAGLSLKLRSLRREQTSVASVMEELDELETQLGHEQRDLRMLLAALREPSVRGGKALMQDQLRLLARRLERQWGVRCPFEVEPAGFELERWLHHEIELLVREGVANAVRHGSA
ncbi:MAG: putative signal transduction histidine kinase, partial [Alphaproteobacteria bacterium]|nr:putative signal transduction histidine kinase [Alphaproteobacteria bacterium]